MSDLESLAKEWLKLFRPSLIGLEPLKFVAYVNDEQRSGAVGIEDVPVSTWEEALAWGRNRVVENIYADSRQEPRIPRRPTVSVQVMQVLRTQQVDGPEIFRQEVDAFRAAEEQRQQAQELEQYRQLKAKYEGTVIE